MLELSGVCASYGSVPAITNVSITIGEGEAVGLLGANAPGTTPTLPPASGKASGRPRADAEAAAGDGRRTLIGSRPCHDRRDLREDRRYPQDGHRDPLGGAERRPRAVAGPARLCAGKRLRDHARDECGARQQQAGAGGVSGDLTRCLTLIARSEATKQSILSFRCG